TRVSGAIGASVIPAVSARAAPSKASATVDPKPRTPTSASWENSSQPIVDAAPTAELRTLFGASVIRLHLGNADCTGGTRRIGTSSADSPKIIVAASQSTVSREGPAWRRPASALAPAPGEHILSAAGSECSG